VLASITEELMFRGALFAHLRRHMPWGLAAVIVAIIFATIHPQGVAAIPLLACVAINLAIIRYWRGSSIANITAHALNNGTVMLFAIMIAQ
ncbi:MAG TPA: CPBP family intramembrane metalloprotease, partial [Tepidisphaeraceae bacterium]|nr:CPBP family intramembrane metalloprotease [Tepidisphaeraceae bacterium]